MGRKTGLQLFVLAYLSLEVGDTKRNKQRIIEMFEETHKGLWVQLLALNRMIPGSHLCHGVISTEDGENALRKPMQPLCPCADPAGLNAARALHRGATSISWSSQHLVQQEQLEWHHSSW